MQVAKQDVVCSAVKEEAKQVEGKLKKEADKLKSPD